MFAEDTGVRILHALLFEYRRGSHGGGALIWEHVVYRQRGTLEEEWSNGPEVRRHKKGRDVGAKQTARGSTFSDWAAESRYFMGRHTLLLWDAVRDFLWVEAVTAGGAARIVTRLRLSVCLSFCLQSLAASERASETQRRERERGGGEVLEVTFLASLVAASLFGSSPLPLSRPLLQLVRTFCRVLREVRPARQSRVFVNRTRVWR